MSTLPASSKRALIVVALWLPACQSRGGEDAAASADTHNATSTNASGSAATGDSAFLALMSDHHQGLIAMAEDAKERGPEAVRRDAARLADQQKKEQQQMLQHLSAQYGGRHDPEVMPKNQAMADSLQQLSGEAYSRMFYHHVIAHHQEGIRMMDSAAADLSDSMVKGMTARMRQQQTRETEEFKDKMAHHMEGNGHEMAGEGHQ